MSQRRFQNYFQRSLSRILFWRVLLYLALGVSAIAVISYGIIGHAVNTFLHNHIVTTQNLFVDNVTQDVLAYAHSEVHRKCSDFMSNETVTSVRVVSSNGFEICNLSGKIPSVGGTTETSKIFFDEAKTKEAATVEVTYSGTLFSNLRGSYVTALLFTACVIALAGAMLARAFSRRISKPVELLSATMKQGDLKRLIEVESQVTASGIPEIAGLGRGTAFFAEQIQTYQRELVDKTAFEAIAQTTQVFAHDVRRPLSLARSLIDELQQPRTPEEFDTLIREVGSEIDASANRIEAMIDEVLSAKPLSSESLSQVSLKNTVETALQECRRVFPTRKIAFDLIETAPAQILVDASQIVRVISNIVSNAVEATKGECSLHAEISVLDDETCALSITNFGSSIPLQNLEKLFDPYFTSGKTNGTGLGLAIAKQIITRHGGNIHCESANGPQSFVTFRIQLPLIRQRHLPEKMREVTVIEDSYVIRTKWKRKLSGVTVNCFESPTQFFNHVKNDRSFLSRQDCIITDLNFQETESLNGIDVAEGLRRDRFEKCVVLATLESLPFEKLLRYHRIFDHVTRAKAPDQLSQMFV